MVRVIRPPAECPDGPTPRYAPWPPLIGLLVMGGTAQHGGATQPWELAQPRDDPDGHL